MWITVDDLTPFADIDLAKAMAMIEDAEASALLAAPCLNDPLNPLTDSQTAAVKAVLRQAILRWNDSGSGSLLQETIGQYSATYDTRQRRYGGLSSIETARLQGICGSRRRAFELDTMPATVGPAGVYGVDYVWTRPDTWVPLP